MSTTESSADDPTVGEQLAGLWAFLRRALRFWHVVLAALVVGGIALGAFFYLRQPKFRSETVILYVEKGGTEEDTESRDAQRGVTLRLKELLLSRPNLERIVSRFDLYPELRRRYGMIDAIEELKKHIDFRAPGGDTFSIAFEGGSARQAQAVTAELARQVLEGDAELRKKQTQVALDFLIGERQTREAELRQAEEKLAEFMAQHPRFALDTTPLANGAAIRASMGGAAVAAAPGRQVWAPRPRELPAPAAANAGNPPSPPVAAGPGSAAEARARAALAAARESLTEKLAHYTPAHPDVRAAEADVQRATERLAAVMAGAAQPAGNEASAPPAPPAAATPSAQVPPRSTPAAPRLAAAVVVTPPTPAPAERAQGLVELETEWLKLTRAVTEARHRQDQIESQLFRADIQASSATGGHGVQVNVIDPAFLPHTPLPPGRTTWAAIFLGASLVLGALGAMLFAVFDERIFTTRELGAVGEVLAEVSKRPMRRANVIS
jgi:capsular polysaccharide biosynthesis protein